MPPTRDELIDAYRHTRFLVRPTEGEPPFEVRLGRNTAELEALLARLRLSCFAIVGAYNPAMARPPLEVNRERHERLREDLGGYRFWETEGVGTDGFREPGFFVWHMTEGEARRIGQRFGQLAVVCGAPFCETTLLILDEGAIAEPASPSTGLEDGVFDVYTLGHNQQTQDIERRKRVGRFEIRNGEARVLENINQMLDGVEGPLDERRQRILSLSQSMYMEVTRAGEQ